MKNGEAGGMTEGRSSAPDSEDATGSKFNGAGTGRNSGLGAQPGSGPAGGAGSGAGGAGK
jgi:hypothetical protein